MSQIIDSCRRFWISVLDVLFITTNIVVIIIIIITAKKISFGRTVFIPIEQFQRGVESYKM